MPSNRAKFYRLLSFAALANNASKISVYLIALVWISLVTSQAHAAVHACQLDRNEEGIYQVALHESAADEMSKTFGDTFRSQAPSKTLKEATLKLIDKYLSPQKANLSTKSATTFFSPKISLGNYYLQKTHENQETTIYKSNIVDKLDEVVLSVIIFSSYKIRNCHWNDKNYYVVLLSADITISILFQYCVVEKLDAPICELSSIKRHGSEIRKDLERLKPLIGKHEQGQLSQAKANLDILLGLLELN